MSTLENNQSPTKLWYLVYFMLGGLAIIPGLVVCLRWRNRNIKAAKRHLMVSVVLAILLGVSLHIATYDNIAPFQLLTKSMIKLEPQPQREQIQREQPPEPQPQGTMPCYGNACPEPYVEPQTTPQKQETQPQKAQTQPPQKEQTQKQESEQGKYGIAFPLGRIPTDLLSPEDLEFKIESLREELLYLDEELQDFMGSGELLTPHKGDQVRDLEFKIESLREELGHLDEVLWGLMYSNESLYESRLDNLRDLESKIESLREELLYLVDPGELLTLTMNTKFGDFEMSHPRLWAQFDKRSDMFYEIYNVHDDSTIYIVFLNDSDCEEWLDVSDCSYDQQMLQTVVEKTEDRAVKAYRLTGDVKTDTLLEDRIVAASVIDLDTGFVVARFVSDHGDFHLELRYEGTAESMFAFENISFERVE